MDDRPIDTLLMEIVEAHGPITVTDVSAVLIEKYDRKENRDRLKARLDSLASHRWIGSEVQETGRRTHIYFVATEGAE